MYIDLYAKHDNRAGVRLVTKVKVLHLIYWAMKRHGNLFCKIVDFDNLGRAYFNSIKGKSKYKEIQKFKENEIENLELIQKSLCNKTFKTGSYREKKVYEPKERTLYILPYAPDRIVQHALMQVLIPVLDPLFIYDSYACRNGKGQHAGSRKSMELVVKYKYCLKCDIEKFYPSIDHAILKKFIRQKIKCKDTLWLIDNIIDSFPSGKNVPIGNYTSQWFANYYMTGFDLFVKQELGIKGYVRYCDDFVLFHDDKKYLHECLKKIHDYCNNKLLLKLSKGSVFPCKQGLDFLGYRHFPNGYILLRKSTAKRVQKRIQLLHALRKKNRLDYIKARSQIGSTLGWIKHANTYNLAKSMHVKELFAEIKEAINVQKHQAAPQRGDKCRN